MQVHLSRGVRLSLRKLYLDARLISTVVELSYNFLRLIYSPFHLLLRHVNTHPSSSTYYIHYHGRSSWLEGGRAGISQSNQECERQHCTQQSDGTHCMRVW